MKRLLAVGVAAGATFCDGAGDAGRVPGGRLVPGAHLDFDGDWSASRNSS